MKLIRACALVLPLGLMACNASLPQLAETGAVIATAAGYGNQVDTVRAIKDALVLGSDRATNSLSAAGGYANSAYRIQLPANLQTAANTARQLGFGSQIDKVEALMNQGAERAAGEAQAVFAQSVRNMTVTDALGIVRGGNNAATTYFRGQTEAALRARYAPIIEQSLTQVGFYQQYKQLQSTYNMLPIANKPSLDLEQHAMNMALDGLFKQMAKEEAAIRQDPVGRGSALIGSVFQAK